MSLSSSISNKILFLNIIIVTIMTIIDKFWNDLGFSKSDNVYYALIGMIVFGISIGGAIVGIVEYKMKRKKAIIGLIGNLILVVIFLVIFFFIAMQMKK